MFEQRYFPLVKRVIASIKVYRRYDSFKTPMENIAMQDSLISRFDLIFVILDTIEPENDKVISDHVIRIHRYRAPNEQDGDGKFIFAKFHQKLLKILFFQNCNKVLPFGLDVDVLTTLNQEENHETELQVYDKYDATLHGLVHNKK